MVTFKIAVVRTTAADTRDSVLGTPGKYIPFLKGPKHEIFESGFFTEIRPVRIGDLGTGEKKMNFR